VKTGVKWLVGTAILALLGASVAGAQTPQKDYERKAEEYNAYQDILRTQDLKQRLEVIDTFLRTYPQSLYRVHVYLAQLETAYAAQDYARSIQAADAFLGMNKQDVLSVYKQGNPNLEMAALEPAYYRFNLLYTISFLQSFRESEANADAISAKARERAAQALEMHTRLYSMAKPPPGVTPEQFETIKKQEETSLHTALAYVAWRSKDYPKAAAEYKWLLELAPDDARLNYQLARSLLQQATPDYPQGLWYLARAIHQNIPKADEVKDYLTKVVSAYQQVEPQCLGDQVEQLVARSGESVTPAADWKLISGEEVNTVRGQMNLKRIFDDLKVGGETAQMMFLASCGAEIGLAENGQPDLEVLIIEVTQTPENSLTLRVAAGQEAADAKTANIEIKIVEPAEVKNLKNEDVVRIAGKIRGYENNPQFLLKLVEGKVNVEDIPKTRGRGAHGSR